jgi:hypothetical protein
LVYAKVRALLVLHDCGNSIIIIIVIIIHHAFGGQLNCSTQLRALLELHDYGHEKRKDAMRVRDPIIRVFNPLEANSGNFFREIHACCKEMRIYTTGQ